MLEHLYPIAGNNAIESATVAVGWTGDRDHKLLGSFVALLADFQKMGYGESQQIKGFQVVLSPSGMAQSEELVGHTFIKRGHAGVVLREISLRENQFIITIRDYTRWDAMWRDVSVILEKVFPLLTENAKSASSVALQYMDKFQWRDHAKPFPTREALKASPYLLENLLIESPQWHSNQGFYVQTGLQQATQRLDNLNITLAVENNVTTLSLLLAHQYQNLSAGLEMVGVKALLDTAHIANKKYLTQILADDLCSKIGLGRP